MSPTLPIALRPGEIARALKRHLWLWAAPTAIFTLAGLAYALLRPAAWQATQALVVRDESGGGLGRAGRFDNPEALKAALETVQEIARGRAVVEAALRQVGPPSDRASPAAWPTARDIADAQADIAIKPPQGAEFGRTEVVRLTVVAPSRDRAVALNQAVRQQLDRRLRELREEKAGGIIAELEQAAQLARGELDRATAALQAMEREVGPDLGELRTLNDRGAGESNLRSSSNQIKNELRQARAAVDSHEQLLRNLEAAASDPGSLVATPNRLLESQPALRRLKDGLVDAQLRAAEVLSKMNREHPLARAALEAEAQVRRDLHDELEVAVRGVEGELEVGRAQVAALESQLHDVNRRLENLAGIRARYANLSDEVQQRSRMVDQARKELADARASHASAASVSLLTPVDGPETGDRPTGPGRTTIVLAAMVGGLISGLGLVFLASPMGAVRGRRWSDYLGIGRRASDRASSPEIANLGPARRAGDPPIKANILGDEAWLAVKRRLTDDPPGDALDRPGDASSGQAIPGDRRQGDARRRS
jgi:succinoglycan biosynthesis transport protein ExoP